jgi:hypothetical protein
MVVVAATSASAVAVVVVVVVLLTGRELHWLFAHVQELFAHNIIL